MKNFLQKKLINKILTNQNIKLIGISDEFSATDIFRLDGLFKSKISYLLIDSSNDFKSNLVEQIEIPNNIWQVTWWLIFFSKVKIKKLPNLLIFFNLNDRQWLKSVKKCCSELDYLLTVKKYWPCLKSAGKLITSALVVKLSNNRQFSYGFFPSAELSASDLYLDDTEISRCKISYQGKTLPLMLPKFLSQSEALAQVGAMALYLNLGGRLVDLIDAGSTFRPTENPFNPGSLKPKVLTKV